MRIAKLQAENFQGLRRIDISVDTPVLLLCGSNGSGKSSLLDAVRLALLGDLGRISLKKEVTRLIRRGSDVANVRVTDSDGDEHGVAITKAGKLMVRGQISDDPVLPLVLNAQRFAGLKPDDRRTLLYGVMQVSCEPEAIVEQLLKRDLHAEKVKRLTPLLRAGFEGAHQQAKTHASESRGAWKATTGENWGSEKSLTWRDQAATLRAEKERRDALRAERERKHAEADKLARAKTKLDVDRVEQVRVEAELQAARTAAGGGPRVGLVHELAMDLHICIADLRRNGLSVHGKAISDLVTYAQQFGAIDAPARDPQALARIPALEQAQALCASTVANDERAHGAALAAKTRRVEIDAELAVEFDAEAFNAATAQLETLVAQRADIVAKLDADKALRDQAGAAQRKTEEAARHRLDVETWEALADALAPDGIPGELLAQALGPINKRLEQSALDAAWPKVVIGADMEITYGGEQRRMLSASEQWRADAMVAEAIAHLSDERLLLMDAADTLDLQGRADLLAWLDVLADNGEIDTAIVAATLKALPTGLPDTIGAVWLEDGAVKAAPQPLKAAA